MALTTYTAGEVLTAASLNDNLAYAVTVPAAVPGALVFIKADTVGVAVGSVTVSDAFSATYSNYRIIFNGGTMSTSQGISMTLGATTSGYSISYIYKPYASGLTSISTNNGAEWTYSGGGSTASAQIDAEIYNPFATKNTFIATRNSGTGDGGVGTGFLNDSTSYTAFTITPNAGTLTGGSIRVYGYANS